MDGTRETMSDTLSNLKKQFLEHVEIEKGRSIKTVENYDRYLSRFFRFIKNENPKAIDDSSVREFRLWLNRQPVVSGETLSRKTQNYYLIAIRAFLKYLASRGVPSLAPERIELAKTTQRDLDLISEKELERLLAAPNGGDPKSLRDRAILELLFSTGLRVSELCALDTDDIPTDREEFSIRGKGGKIRLVFVSPRARTVLETYLRARKDMQEALFVDSSEKNPERITPRTVQRIVKHYAIAAGISKKVTPHVIRHSFATDLLQNGADIRSVQVLLGHANVATTQIYTHVTDNQLREVHRAFHGKRRR